MSSETMTLTMMAINEAKLDSVHHLEDVEVAAELTPIVDGLDPDEHRWYWISTSVFSVEGGYIGVRGPSSLKSEDMWWDDIGYNCVAFEMEAVATTTYRRRRIKKGE